MSNKRLGLVLCRFSVAAPIRLLLIIHAVLALGFVNTPSAWGQAVRSQAVTLSPGWNAVFLEVDPLVSDPAQLFADTPVDVIASYTAASRGAQFVKDPSADMLSAYGWSVWYAQHRPDAFLTDLFAVHGGLPYLIHSATNASLEIMGQVPPCRQTWAPDAYNFVGFPVESPGGPTFEQFFKASSAHNHNKIYRMRNGIWRQVTNAAMETMRSGEAFWIYCDGPSDYSGPLQVETPFVSGLLLTQGGASSLVFRNRAAHPLSIVVEHIVEHNDPIPMAVTIRAVDTDKTQFHYLTVPFPAGPWVQDFPPLEGGKAFSLPIELRLAESQSGVRHSLLKIRTDLGTETYVSVTSQWDE